LDEDGNKDATNQRKVIRKDDSRLFASRSGQRIFRLFFSALGIFNAGGQRQARLWITGQTRAVARRKLGISVPYRNRFCLPNLR